MNTLLHIWVPHLPHLFSSAKWSRWTRFFLSHSIETQALEERLIITSTVCSNSRNAFSLIDCSPVSHSCIQPIFSLLVPMLIYVDQLFLKEFFRRGLLRSRKEIYLSGSQFSGLLLYGWPGSSNQSLVSPVAIDNIMLRCSHIVSAINGIKQSGSPFPCAPQILGTGLPIRLSSAALILHRSRESFKAMDSSTKCPPHKHQATQQRWEPCIRLWIIALSFCFLVILVSSVQATTHTAGVYLCGSRPSYVDVPPEPCLVCLSTYARW
jgi:hypothetical protein